MKFLFISLLVFSSYVYGASVSDRYTAEELALLQDAFSDNKLDSPVLQLVVYAIGIAEGRRSDKYHFGIKHPRCSKTDFRQQSGWCAATVRNSYQRWLASDRSVPFIKHMGLRYCPPQDDPVGHVNWVKNVTFWTTKFKEH